MAMKIISEKPITMAELKQDIQKIKERDKELNFRAQKTEEYLNMFVDISPEKAKELGEKIEKLNIPRFKHEHIAKIIDTMPQSADELKSVLSAYPLTVTNENLKKIADIVSHYLPKSKKAKKEAEEE